MMRPGQGIDEDRGPAPGMSTPTIRPPRAKDLAQAGGDPFAGLFGQGGQGGTVAARGAPAGGSAGRSVTPRLTPGVSASVARSPLNIRGPIADFDVGSLGGDFSGINRNNGMGQMLIERLMSEGNLGQGGQFSQGSDPKDLLFFDGMYSGSVGDALSGKGNPGGWAAGLSDAFQMGGTTADAQQQRRDFLARFSTTPDQFGYWLGGGSTGGTQTAVDPNTLAPLPPGASASTVPTTLPQLTRPGADPLTPTPPSIPIGGPGIGPSAPGPGPLDRFAGIRGGGGSGPGMPPPIPGLPPELAGGASEPAGPGGGYQAPGSPLQDQLNQFASSFLDSPSRYDLGVVKQGLDLIGTNFDESLQEGSTYLDELMSQRGAVGSSIELGERADLFEDLSRVRQQETFSLAQDFARTQAGDRATAAGVAQGAMGMDLDRWRTERALELQAQGLSQQDAQFQADLELRDRLGMNGQRLDELSILLQPLLDAGMDPEQLAQMFGFEVPGSSDPDPNPDPATLPPGGLGTFPERVKQYGEGVSP